MSSGVQDFAVNQPSKLGHAVHGRAIELERFSCGRIIHGDLIESFAYVDDLAEVSLKSRLGPLTYMYWPESLLHMVDSEQVGGTCKSLKQ